MLVKCNHCEKEFEKLTKYVNYSNKHNLKHYCSKECLTNSKNNRIECKCGFCSKIIYKTPSEINRSKSGLSFCDKSCACSYNNSILRTGENNYKYIDGKSLNTNYINKAFKLYKAQCAKCLISDIDCLEIHHIDENHNNNEDNNLLILCSNCHSLIHKNRFTVKDCSIEKIESFQEYKEVIQDKFKNKCSVCLKFNEDLNEDKICTDCVNKYLEFPDRKLPDKNILNILIKSSTKSELGRYFQVSATTVANRIK